MKALVSRLNRMEKARGGRPCPCGGPYRISLVMEIEDYKPGPCPRCKTYGKVIWLVEDTPPPGWVADEGRAPCTA